MINYLKDNQAAKRGVGISTIKKKWEDISVTDILNFVEIYSQVDSGEYKLPADMDVVDASGSDSFTQTVPAST